MNILNRLDMVSLILSSLILLSLALVMIALARKRFEVALIVLMLSLTIHWLASPADLPDVEELLEVGPESYVRILLVFLTGIAGVLLFIRTRAGSGEKIPVYFKILGLFILYALLSTIYSIDATFTFVRSLELLAFSGFLLGLHSWIKEPSDVDKVLRIMFFIMATYILVNALSLAVMPDRAWNFYATNRFQGLTGHPNTIGEFCMITYPLGLWMLNRTSSMPSKALILMILGGALGMHILSGSRSSLAASAICFMLWPILMRKKFVALAAILIVLGSGAFLILNKPASFERNESASITTLTGRDAFWRGCAILIMEHPVRGYGYAVSGKIWEDPRFQSAQTLWSGTAKASLHNGYLDIIIGLGIPGFFLWLGFILPPSVRTFLLPANDNKIFFLVILAQILFINIFESVFGGSRSLGSLLLMVTLVMAAKMSSLEHPAPSIIGTHILGNEERKSIEHKACMHVSSMNE